MAFLVGCQEDTPPSSGNSVEVSQSAVPDEPKDADRSLEATEELKDGIYFVANYDPKRDGSADLESAISTAGKLNKRILLEVGGDW